MNQIFKYIFLCFFIPFSLKGLSDYDTVVKNYKQGRYDGLLKEYDFLCGNWLKQGKFLDYITSRNEAIRERLYLFEENIRKHKRHQREIYQLEHEKNCLLREVINNYPEEYIAQIVRHIVRYHELLLHHEEAVSFQHYLEMGIVDGQDDPVVFLLQDLLFEYHLKYILISSLLRDCQLDPDSALLHTVVLDLDKVLHIKKLCEQHPDSCAARTCLEAFEVEEAKLPVVYEQKYLSDMLVGMQAPCNDVENRVRLIIKNYYLRKMDILDH